MANEVGVRAGILYPQPEFTIAVDKDGKWTGTKVYRCHRDSAVGLMPRPGSKHPDAPFMELVNASTAFMDCTLAEITCQYAGAEAKDEADEKGNATYSLGLSLSEEPLLSHVRYADLTTRERDALKLLISGKEKDDQEVSMRDRVTSELGLEALAKIDRGQSSYYSPRVTWHESWVRDKPAEAAELNDIGNIATPTGPVPALAGGRTWLKNGVTQTQDGKSYRLENEWLMSDRGGWDEDLYVDPP